MSDQVFTQRKLSWNTDCGGLFDAFDSSRFDGNLSHNRGNSHRMTSRRPIRPTPVPLPSPYNPELSLWTFPRTRTCPASVPGIPHRRGRERYGNPKDRVDS
eukprot:scaffold1923_cov333-Pavlova_lutheri.AAC.7